MYFSRGTCSRTCALFLLSVCSLYTHTVRQVPWTRRLVHLHADAATSSAAETMGAAYLPHPSVRPPRWRAPPSLPPKSSGDPARRRRRARWATPRWRSEDDRHRQEQGNGRGSNGREQAATISGRRRAGDATATAAAVRTLLVSTASPPPYSRMGAQPLLLVQ